MLALFGVVMLMSGLLAWRLHVPEGPSTGGIIYGENSNYLTDLTPGTSGQVLMTQGAGTAPAWANAALATSAGVRMAAGSVVLDGANPTTAATGLTTVSSCTLTPITATALGDNANLVESVQTWDAATSTWKKWLGVGNTANTIQKFEPNTVYWVQVNRAFTVLLPK